MDALHTLHEIKNFRPVLFTSKEISLPLGMVQKQESLEK